MKKKKRSLRARRDNIFDLEIIDFDERSNRRVDKCVVDKHRKSNRDKEQYKNDRRRLVFNAYHNQNQRDQKHEYLHDYTRRTHKFIKEDVHDHRDHRHQYSKNFAFYQSKHNDRIKEKNKNRRERSKNKENKRDRRYNDERFFKDFRSKYKKVLYFFENRVKF